MNRFRTYDKLKPRSVRGFETRMHAEIWDPYFYDELRHMDLGLEMPSDSYRAPLRHFKCGARFQRLETAHERWVAST